MDFEQMRIVNAIEDCGSMRTAAAMVHLSETALLHQANSIERELGFSLFDRTRTGTSLTPAGKAVSQGFRTLRVRYTDGVAMCRESALSHTSGKIRFASEFSVCEITSLIASACAEHFPTMEFTLVPLPDEESIEAVASGQIDLAIHAGSLERTYRQRGIRYEKLYNDPVVCILSETHRLAGKKQLALRDLRGETVWVVPQGLVSRVADDIRTHIATREKTIEVRDFVHSDVVFNSVVSEGTVAIYGRNGARGISNSGIEVLPFDWPDHEDLGVIYRKAKAADLAPVVDFIKAVFKDTREGIWTQHGLK